MAEQSYVDQARALGYSDEQVNQWLAPWMAHARDAGYSQDQINQHLGIKPPPAFDDKAAAETIKANLAGAQKPVTSLTDALEAGWQMSTAGLIARGQGPDKTVSPEAPMYSRIAGQVAQMAGDVPAMMGGFVAGAAGAAFTGPGAAVAGSAGAFALPTVLRETLMDAYGKGTFSTFSDFWDRMAPVMIDTAKSYITGAATGGAGAAAKAAEPAIAAALPASISPAVNAATKTAAEITTMTTVGAALEGHAPSAQDFIDAAIVMGGLKFAEVGAAKLRAIYAKTGVPPSAVVEDASKDVSIQQDLLSGRELPTAYEAALQEHAAQNALPGEPGAGEAPPGETPRANAIERLPPEPERLTSFIIRNGGINDVGGDVRNLMGSPKQRPGLLNGNGLFPDDMAQRVGEAGFFPELGGQRPTIDQMLEKLDEDQNRYRPVYSHNDQVAAEAFQSAVQQSAEIDRISQQTGIDTANRTPEQFWDAVAEHMSHEEIAAEQASLEQAHAATYEDFEAAAREHAQASGSTWNPDQFYGADQARSLQDLENEHGQENAALAAQQRNGGDAQSGVAGGSSNQGQAGSGQVGGAAGDGGRAAAEAGGGGGRTATVDGGQGGGPPIAGDVTTSPPEPPRDLAEARARIRDRLDVGGKEPRRGWSFSRFYTDTIDRLFPIWDVARETAKDAGLGKLPADTDPGILARLYAGATGVATRALKFDTIDFNTREANGPGLETVLAPVAENLDAFREYVASVRALELNERGIETGFDLNAAQMVADAGRERFGPVQQALHDYQGRIAAYARDAGVISREGYNAMLEANRTYVPFQRLMEPDEGVPSRLGGGSLQARNPLHAIEGSQRIVIDPLESVIRNTFTLTQMAERNNVGRALVDLLEHAAETGSEARDVSTAAAPMPGRIATILRDHGVEVPDALASLVEAASPVGEGQIRVLRDGKPFTYDVDPELARAFKGLDLESASWLEKMLGAPARTLRAGATLLPDFAVKNLMRDFTTAFINTGKGVFSPIDTMKGFLGVIREDADYQRWLSEGGANAAMVSLDRNYLQNNIRELTEQTGLGTRAWNVVRHPIDTLRMVSELTEQATRLGEFKGVYDKAIEAGKDPAEAGREAAFSSREVTLDFARMGAKMRSANTLIAFFNAQLQGVDRLARSFKDYPVSTSLRVLAGITLPSIALWYANHDDPRWDDIPRWQKDMFWIVMTDKWEDATPQEFGQTGTGERRMVDGQWQVNRGHIFRIPKPFETGILFGSGAERTMDAFFGKTPDAFKGLGDSIASGLLPSFVPTVALPVVEQFANRSTFVDRTLVPDSMEKQLPEYQYTPYTTEAAKALGQMMGAFPGMRATGIEPGVMGAVARSLSSPILLENYLRAWTGNLGVYALQTADLGLRKAGVLPDPVQPAATLADIPFVKAFVVRYPTASAQPIQDFYDDYDKAKVYLDTWTKQAKDGDLAAAAKIAAVSPGVAQSGMTDMAATMHGIGVNPPNVGGQRTMGQMFSPLMRKSLDPETVSGLADTQAQIAGQKVEALGASVTLQQLGDIRGVLSEQSQIIRDIYKNPDIKPEEKRQLIDTAYWRMIELSKIGNAAMARANAVIKASGDPVGATP